MAQVWVDNSDSMNSVVYDNVANVFRFKWQFITFSGETQDKAQIRWRKMGLDNVIANAASPHGIHAAATFAEDLVWLPQNYTTVAKLPFNENFNITNIDFATNTLSPGMWAFQVNFWATGATDWSGWSSTHRIEISPWEHNSTFSGPNGSSQAVVKGPHPQNEGTYGVRTEVMSSAGISAVSNEQTFRFWETNKYQKQADGTLQARPELRHNGTIIGRVKRTT